jgi:carboxyl-terminal processing protease
MILATKRGHKPLPFFYGGLLLFLSTVAVAKGDGKPLNALQVFDASLDLIQAHYYAPKEIAPAEGGDVRKKGEARRQKLRATSSLAEVQKSIQEILASKEGTANDSAAFLLRDDQEYWAIKSAFSSLIGDNRWTNCGAWFERHGAHYYVREVFTDNSVKADEKNTTSLLRGDQIITPGFHPVATCEHGLKDAGDRVVTLSIRRLPWEEPRKVKLTSKTQSMAQMLLAEAKASEKIYVPKIKTKEHAPAIGYFRLTAGTHPEFLHLTRDVLGRFSKTTDAMVIDLRGGLGGVSSAYLQPFLESYLKPLVVLIDGTTTGGKEVFAFLLKKQRGAVLVGTRTPGLLLAGETFDVIPGEAMLYLPVAKPAGLSGKLLHHGIGADILVETPLLYSAGGDPALSRAVEIAAAQSLKNLKKK